MEHKSMPWILFILLQVISIAAFPAQIEKVKALQTYRDTESLAGSNSVFIGRYPRQSHITRVPAEQTESRALERNNNFPRRDEQTFNNELTGFGKLNQESQANFPSQIKQIEATDTFPAFIIRNPRQGIENQASHNFEVTPRQTFGEAVVNSEFSFDSSRQFPTAINTNVPSPMLLPLTNFRSQSPVDSDQFTSISQLPLENSPTVPLEQSRITFPEDVIETISGVRQFENEIKGSQFRSPTAGRALNQGIDLQSGASNAFSQQQNSASFVPGKLESGFSPCGPACFLGR